MVCLLIVCFVVVAASADLIPFDSRWEYPHHVTFRPADGQVPSVNPPRMSWPYVPHVITSETVPVRSFWLQLSRVGDFAAPDVEVRDTPYNFHNALPVLEAGEWRWRVGYSVGTDYEVWSAARSFIIAGDTPTWDRTAIDRAAEILAAKPHPRLAPGIGWDEWREVLEADPETAAWLGQVIGNADKAAKRDWWADFPVTDAKDESPYDDQQWAGIAGEIAAAAFAYRLTGDEKYAPARDLAVALAGFAKGGMASPEYHGPPRKWPTQITEYLAVCYDWLYEDMDEADRATVRDSVQWRLRATYLEKASWQAGGDIHRSGVSMFCQSHPYENFMWSMPGVMLMAGDLDLADELVPLCLNYLTGVTSAHGPDEGWNEGLAYGGWKGESMLRASMYVQLLVPDLRLDRNPYYARLGDWYAHLMPLGIQRIAFGDYAADPKGKRGTQRNDARYAFMLTGETRFRDRWHALREELGSDFSARPWLEMLASGTLPVEETPSEEIPSDVFKEAGWVMASTRKPSEPGTYEDAVGMIFKCRPRGGYGHSFRSEGDFVWHAFGQVLSAGGGSTAYPDPHARHSMSHNVVLVNGVGQEWNPRDPAYPFCGRLLAYQEADGYTYWAGDMTNAYQTVPGLLRWHRHVVFVGGEWFAIYDDLAMKPGADPARFSRLFHVAPDAALNLDGATATYAMENVRANVSFGRPDGLDIVDAGGRESFRNQITGEDMYEKTSEALQSKGRGIAEANWMAHSIWATNTEPAMSAGFITVLTAWRDSDAEPRIIMGEASAEVEGVAVSFGGGDADIVVDVPATREHALATDPLPAFTGADADSVEIGGDAYQVEWIAKETFDGGLQRWAIEGTSEVQVRDGKLAVRDILDDKANVGTFWFRQDLPRDVFIRFRAKAVAPADQNAANLNLFLHATELDGSPLRYGRTGQYSLYHEIPNYIVTLVGGTRDGWSRARRDPGFNLIHEAEARSEVGTEYEICVTYVDGRLRYYLDGKKLHDVTDEDPLPGGKFGIRTWSTDAWWDDVEIGRVVSE